MSRRRNGHPWLWALVLLAIGAAVTALCLKIRWDVAERFRQERNARACLKTIAFAEADFRDNDRDGNGREDYWVADVAGLYTLRSASGDMIWLIEQAVALADEAPSKESWVELVEIGVPAPKGRYGFRALSCYEDGSGDPVPYNTGEGRHPARFGFVATPGGPEADRLLTLIISETKQVFGKLMKGGRVDTFPRDPLKAGWSKVD